MDLHIHIDVSKLGRQLENLPVLLRQAVEGGLTRATVLLRNAVETNIRTPFGDKPPAVASGFLASSVAQEVYSTQDHLIGQVFLGYPADQYGLFVEVGTRPHTPPLWPIMRWLNVKFGMTNPKALFFAAQRVAFEISERGTRGHFMFQRALDEHERVVLRILQEEITRSLAELN